MEIIGQFLQEYGRGAIFVILLLKGLGLPIPVPGDFVLLLAAVGVASGTYPLWGVIGHLQLPDEQIA